MNGTLLFTPTVPRVSRWLRPRAEATTTYTMTRDPNARSLIGPGDLQLDSIAFADTLDAADLARLPRRLGATRLLSAGLALDVGRALLDRAGPDTARGRGLRRLAAVFRPLDLTVSRTLTSSFDATAADPGVGVQFGLGGLGSLREIDGRKATAAGLVDRVTVTNALALPFGVTLTNRAEVADTRTWWRRAFSNAQAEGEGELRTLPDVTARWSYRPAWAARVFSALDASAGLRRQTQTTRAPVEAFGSALGSALGDLTADDVDVRSTRVASYPLSAGLTWSLLGGLRTDGGVSLVRRDDELPGNRIGSTTRDGNFAASRAFTPPKRWGLKSNITTRGGFQRSRTRAIISPRTSLNAFAPVVQADTERETFSFSANSDVAESLTLSLTGNHVVTANNALNQRFSQTVLSAVLQLTFFSGRLR